MTSVSAPEMLDLAADDPEALLDLYARNGWGDGLPMVAPTRERVDAMLAALGDVDPDEPLATLPPRFGAATRRIVAVNAVLAGCRPEYLAVIVSAVRALARPELNLRGVNATTHPVAPLLVVHGDVVDAAGYNAGIGTFGPGTRANATTGRAVRLVLLHVAGAVPGPGDASTQGGPAKYSYCIAENLAATPWESYPASRGIDAPSAVTVHCGEAPHNFHDMESEEPARILDKCASAMASLGQNNAPVSGGEYFVVLGPEHAATAAAHGWTRRDVSAYLFEKARLPATILRRSFDVVSWEPWKLALGDGDLVPMTGDPDNIRVLVAGGPGKHSSVIPSWGITKSVTLPV
ncbi:MAG TPA: hypothetical protein VFC99_08360, partial [Acidimicrobiia bacterium]|nr:hypothetical protein [Acidimicrobiia bacterium]